MRFTNTPSPFASRANSVNHDYHSSEPPSPILEDAPPAGIIAQVVAWWRARFVGQPDSFQSQYLTLIPLSGRQDFAGLLLRSMSHVNFQPAWWLLCGVLKLLQPAISTITSQSFLFLQMHALSPDIRISL